MLTRFGKQIQRQTYTLLGTRWGLLLLLLLCVISLNATLRIVDSTFGVDFTYPTWTSKRDFKNNIVKRSFEDYLCHEPIDVVYTWVNGSDPWMQNNLQRYKFIEKQSLFEEFENSTFDESKVNPSRFQDNQELRYSLRSLMENAGWIRNIYIVTNGQIPHWLNIDHPKIRIVTHHDIYLNKSHLPVFASPSIECHLHRIPGLSPRFLYLNDDTFFGRPVHPEDFRSSVEGHRIYFAWPVPNCAEGCPQTWVGDGYCDKTCNTEDCQWDGGDCLGKKSPETPPAHYSYAPTRNGDDQCYPGCPDSWLGDKFCDKNCNHLSCGYDAADCSWDDALANIPIIDIYQDYTDYSIEYQAVFIANLTSIFTPEDTISGGSFDTSIFRSATISQATKLLILICNLNKKPTSDVTTLLELAGNRKQESGDMIEVMVQFNVTLLVPDGNVTVTETLDVLSDGSRHLTSIEDDIPTKSYKSISVVNEFTPMSEQAIDSPPDKLLQSEADYRQWYQKQKSHNRKLSELGESAKAQAADWRSVESLWAAQFGTVLSKDDLQEELQSSKRKLLDTFGDSLKHVNRLLTTRFGASARKVPSHMPHFIDSQVVREMHTEWAKEFDATSSHRFREKTDMQYTFTHMYWITHATNKKNDYAFFTERMDINHNGVLDPSEVRNTAIILWDRKVTIETMDGILSPDYLTSPEESSPEDEGWRFTNLNASILAKWRANLTAVSYNTQPDFEEAHIPADLLEKECQFGSSSGESLFDEENEQEVDFEATKTTIDLEATKTAIGVEETMTQVLLPPLRCWNETVITNGTWNGTVIEQEEYRQVCDRTWPTGEDSDSEEVEPPVWTWKPPPPEDDQEPTMGDDYVSMVSALIELAAAGVKRDRLIRPSITGKLTAYHFADSHIAELLQQGDEQKRYKSVVMDEDEISFFMVRDNATVAQRQMDHMLLKKSKFMCINDNMNHSNPDALEVKKVIFDFMRSYFPIRTPFELPDGVVNEHLHTFEYTPAQQKHYGWSLPSGLDPYFEESMTAGRPHPGYVDDFVSKVTATPSTVFDYVPMLWVPVGVILLIYVINAVKRSLYDLIFGRNPHPVPSAMC